MNCRKINSTLLMLAASFVMQQSTAAQQYELLNSLISNGGGMTSNSGFQLDCAVGEPAIGEGSNANFTMQAGFVPAVNTTQEPPATWIFTGNTGASATIGVKAEINPTIGGRTLQTADAVGVFFDRNGSLVCAGYGLWQSGQNMAITAWGDNSQTQIKDGFAEGELMRYRIWDAAEGREYEAIAAYSSGGPSFANGGIYELSSLRAVTTFSHNIALTAGWNTISSYIEPTTPDLETLLAGIIPQMVIMKNGRGQVFWPALGINQIGNWNPPDGYQIFMQSPVPLVITGNEIVSEATPIALQSDWNLVAYLRNSPMPIAQALASIADKLIIVKNNAGDVYWPALGINQIGNMVPGQGYLMNLSMAATLIYPANGGAGMGSMLTQGNTPEHKGTREISSYVVTNTGANATLLVQVNGLSDGDEVIVRASQKIVGRSILHEGKTLVTIWGDNEITQELREGAMTGEELVLEAWSTAEQKTKLLVLTSLSDALSGQTLGSTLRYETNAVWVAEVAVIQEIPSTFMLAQNYPNPFNPSTIIKYGLPHDAKVKLEIYDMLGQRIAVLFEGQQRAGYHEAIFENFSLPSGVYFYRLLAGPFDQTMKMLLVR